LAIECEEIKFVGEGPKLCGHTAQIFGQKIYVYCGEKKDSSIWKFPLRLELKDVPKEIQHKVAWKLEKPKGEGPGLLQKPKSFLIEDKMYVYEGEKNPNNTIFILDLCK